MKLKIITLFICGILAYFGCGKLPTSLPLPFTGSITISARAAGDTAIDSVQVKLDEVDYGTRENPCTLTDVVIGEHQLWIKHENTAPKIQTVEVLRDETTTTTVTLTFQGPYVGNEAPQFSAVDLDETPFSLQEHRGKVVLLAFFEHT